MRRLPGPVLVPVLLVALWGCESEQTPAATVKPLKAHGSVATTFLSQPVSVDYEGAKASVDVVYKINPKPDGYGCVTSLDMALEHADEACRLELQWRPVSGGLTLTGAKFYAVRAWTQDGVAIKTKACPGWPEPPKTELVFSAGESPAASINMDPIPPGKSSKASVTFDDLSLTMTGSIDLVSGGKKVTFDLGKLSVKGTVQAKGSTAVSCGLAVGGRTGPNLCTKTGEEGGTVGKRLRRTPQPVSCDTGMAYDLGEFCGADAIVVVDWREWVAKEFGNALLKDLPAIFGKFKGKTVAMAVVVVEGEQHVVVKNAEGKFEASGPPPTADECKAIATKNALPVEIVMLRDDAAKFMTKETSLTETGKVPAVLVAKRDGTIVETLPKGDKSPTATEIEAAIQAAIDAP